MTEGVCNAHPLSRIYTHLTAVRITTTAFRGYAWLGNNNQLDGGTAGLIIGTARSGGVVHSGYVGVFHG